MSASVLARFEGVSKSYDGKSFAVRDLDLDVREGEFLTLLGPSGSGKTTTLMMLAGFDAPTSGDIVAGGKSIVSVPPYKRDFGVVFQNYALFPHMSVLENVIFPLTVRGMPPAAARAKATQALELVRLGAFASRRPQELSGGQQQRAAVARAVVFDPLLVLMDEPFGALDKSLREQMQLEMKHIRQRLGNTMISVTHDQSEALTMSDRIAVFDHGRLQQVGTPEEVYERPANSFVARFIGVSNMALGLILDVENSVCKVRLESGDIAYARCAHPLPVDAEVALSVRPERIRFNPPADLHVNRLPAEVSEIVYGGDHIQLFLTAAGRSDWTIKLAANERPGVAVGDRIVMGWHADDCVLLAR